MTEEYSRHLKFESVYNFRDIGGYPTREGYTVAWRKVFRCGEFRNMTQDDFKRLTSELGVVSVIDLRSGSELENNGKGLLEGSDIKYCNIAFMTDDDDPEANDNRYAHCTNMGEFYLEMARQKDYGKRIIEALEVIADPKNHPIVFHCAVGKDRTGMLAAVLLSLLGVAEKDIIEDYALSEPYMDELLARLKNNPPKSGGPPMDIPDYFWKAAPESMELFLSTLRREYGSISDYLAAQGAEMSLISRLKTALLSR
jgi:protein-tyrosine phosphatase